MHNSDPPASPVDGSKDLTTTVAPNTIWQELGLYLVLLLLCALTLSRNQPDPDFWGHVTYGRDMLAHGLPERITYSYTSQFHTWINHELLSELLMAVGVDRLGATGVLAIKCLLGLAIIGAIMVRASRRGVSMTGLAVVSLLVSVNLMHFWMARPQLLSFVCFTLLLLLLERSFRHWPISGRADPGRDSTPAEIGMKTVRRETHWLWLAAPLLAVWTNSHGGFVAGFAVLAVFLFVRGLEAWTVYSQAAWPLIARFITVVAVSATATLVNPYGLKLHIWLWGSLSEARPEIIEWRRPELLNVAWTPWWLFVALSTVVLWREIHRRIVGRKPRGPEAGDTSHYQGAFGLAELAVLLLLLWQSVEHRRNIPFFVIAVGIWLPTQIDFLLTRLTRGRKATPITSTITSGYRRRFHVSVAIVGVIITAALYNQLRVMPVMRGIYPVSAFQYMADQNLQGRLITRFMWAQYAIAAFGDPTGRTDSIQLAFDGRFRTCYPQGLVDMYFDFALGDHPTEPRNRGPNSPPIDGGRLLRFRDPELVLLDRHQPYPVRLLAAQQPEWVLLYQDQLAQLWGRAAKYGDPASPFFVSPERRHVTQELQEGFVPYPAFPVRRGPRISARQVFNDATPRSGPGRSIKKLDSRLGWRLPASCFCGTRR